LARDPADIKLSDILHALEGSCCLVECVEEEDFCENIHTCIPHKIWEKASFMLKDYFENISLQDLIDSSEK